MRRDKVISLKWSIIADITKFITDVILIIYRSYISIFESNRSKIFLSMTYLAIIYEFIYIGRRLFLLKRHEYTVIMMFLAVPALGVISEISRRKFCPNVENKKYSLSDNYRSVLLYGLKAALIMVIMLTFFVYIREIFFSSLTNLIESTITFIFGREFTGTTEYYIILITGPTYYVSGVAIFLYYRRRRLRDIFQLRRYSPTLFNKEYAKLGLSIVIASPVFLHYMIPIVIGDRLFIEAPELFINRIIVAYVWSLFIIMPFIIVSIGSPNIQVLKHESKCRCETTSQSTIEKYQQYE